MTLRVETTAVLSFAAFVLITSRLLAVEPLSPLRSIGGVIRPTVLQTVDVPASSAAALGIRG